MGGMHMLIVNKKVACTPFPSRETKVVVRDGLVEIKQRKELVPLKVVYDTLDEMGAGAVVWVRGEACKHPFAGEVFEVEEGKPFILVPFEFVVAWNDEG